MDYASAAAASYANRVVLEWEEKLPALVQLCQWIDYAVVWKLAPPNRTLEWTTGYFNDRSSSLTAPTAQRLSYSGYKSCACTNSSSRFSAEALSQRAPLWWTSNSPRLPTGEPKDLLLQQSALQTIVCLPGHGSDANMYCLELASTSLMMESSGLLHELQAFVSGSYVLPGPLFTSTRNLSGPLRGGNSETTVQVGAGIASAAAQAAAASAAVGASLEQFPGVVDTSIGSRRFNPAENGNPCAAAGAGSVLNSFEDELSAASSNLVAPQWFNAQKFGAPDRTFRTHVGSPTMMGTVRDEDMALAVHQDAVAAGSASHVNGVVSTESMANLWASMSDPDVEAQMPGLSSIMSRPTFDSLVMAFENAPTSFAAGDQHMSEAPATSSSCFDNALAGTNLAGYGQDLAFHLLHGQSSSNNSYETLYTTSPESRALSCNASVVELPDSIRRRRSLAPSELDAASLHVDGLMLSQRGDGNPPASLGVGVDQAGAMNPAGTDYAPSAVGQAAFENPFHEQPNPTESVSRNLSRFESFEPTRQSKHLRFDDSRAEAAMVTGSFTEKRRPAMIELWKSELVPRIQESDRAKRRSAAEQQKPLDNHNIGSPTSTVQQQQLSAVGTAAEPRTRIPAAPEPEMLDVPSELLTFSPGWHDDQAHIAHNHKLAERDRRQKFKTKILTLRSIIPSTKKNDKLSVLSNTIDYIRQLKDQIAGLQKPAASSQENMNSVQSPTVATDAGVSLRTQTENSTQQVQLGSTTAAVDVPGPSSTNRINSSTNAVPVSVEVGALKTSDSGASPHSSLTIKVQAPKNPQTLIQILTAVRDLELEIGSFASSSLTNGQVQVALSVLVRSDWQHQTSSWYCNEMQESLERVLNPQNHGLDTSASTNSDSQIQHQQLLRSKSV